MATIVFCAATNPIELEECVRRLTCTLSKFGPGEEFLMASAQDLYALSCNKTVLKPFIISQLKQLAAGNSRERLSRIIHLYESTEFTVSLYSGNQCQIGLTGHNSSTT